MRYDPFYFRRFTQFAQAESWGIFWIQIKTCHIGLIIPVAFWSQKPVSRQNSAQRFLLNRLPLLRVSLMAPDTAAQVWIFRVFVFGHSVGWLTTGDRTPDKYPDSPRGLLFRTHGFMP
jgi:hypothetical protein